MNKILTHITNIFKAFGYSISGWRFALINERSFRDDCILSIALIILAVIFADGFVVFSILVIPVFLLLITELLNSGIEAAIDYISLEKHPMAKLAKDLGSAAVFTSLVLIMIVWSYFLYFLN